MLKVEVDSAGSVTFFLFLTSTVTVPAILRGAWYSPQALEEMESGR